MNIKDDEEVEIRFPRSRLIGVQKVLEQLQVIIELDNRPPITLKYSSATSLNSAFLSLFAENKAAQPAESNISTTISKNINSTADQTNYSTKGSSTNQSSTTNTPAKNTVVTVAVSNDYWKSNAQDFVNVFGKQLSKEGIDLNTASNSIPQKLLIFVREESRAVDTPTFHLEQKIKDLASRYALGPTDVALILWTNNYSAASPTFLEFPSKMSYRTFYLEKQVQNSSLTAQSLLYSLGTWIKGDVKA